MQVFFIIFLLYKIIRAENNETKLIDLLPEKEKEDFLDKIARRILEEVQSQDDNPKDSRELSDDQLNQHDEYVQKILKEESQNLRKKSDETAKKDPVPDIPVISSDKKENVRSEDRYVDLTLRTDHRNKRENNRRIFTGYLSDNETNVEPINGSDSEVDIQAKNFRRSKENVEIAPDETETTIHSEYISVQIVTSTQNDRTEDNDITTQDSISNDYNVTDEENIDILHQKNNSKDLVNEYSKSTENNTATKNVVVKSEIIASTLTVDNNPNIFIFEDPTTNKEIKTPPSSSSRILRSYDENVELNKENNNSKHVDKLEDSKVIKIEVTSATESITNVEVPDIVTLSTQIDVLTTLAPDTMKLLASNNKSDFTTKQDINTEIFSSTNNKAVQDDLVNSQTKNINIDKMPKVLRQNLLDKVDRNKQDAHFNDLKAHYEKNKIKGYEVYEISPEATPFVKHEAPLIKLKTTKKPTTDEQPYYIPVYNYKPENAFFDGHNIYGPHSDSEKEKDIYILGKNNDKDKKRDVSNDDYTLIYKYSPNNAFYDAHNIYGLNDYSNNDQNTYTIKGEDYIDSNTIEKDDKGSHIISKDDDYINKNKFQWDYYFSNDPLRKLHSEVLKENSKIGNVVLFQTNLPIKSPRTKFTYLNLNPNDYIETEYYPGRMGVKKPKDTNCGKYTCDNSREKTTHLPDCKEHVSFEEYNHTNPEYLGDSVRDIRKLMLEQKVFSFIGSPESHSDLSDELEEFEAKELSYLRGKGAKWKAKSFLREKGPKPKGKKTQQDIAIDYYFGRSRIEDENIEEKKTDSIQKDSIKPNDFQIPVEFYNILKFNDNVKNPVTTSFTEKNIARNKNNNGKTDYETMKKIIDMVPSGTDLVTTVLKLQELLKKKTKRTKEPQDIEVIVTVLEDMIKENNKALIQYGWLETTVDLQSAIKKMVDLVEGVLNDADIHPSDLELLKYLVYLHNYAKNELNNHDNFSEELRSLLPRSKRKKGMKTKHGLPDSVWLIRMLEKISPIPEDELKDFEEFLVDLGMALYDLHIALKYIAMVTTYKNQKWFENLKQIFVDSNKKELLQIMLHIWSTRLLGLVEETAKNGLEDDYLSYIKKNVKEIDRTKQEFVFVLKLIEEIKQCR